MARRGPARAAQPEGRGLALLDKTETSGDRRCLGARADPELAQDVPDVDAGRALADEELLRDPLVRVPFDEEGEHLTLPSGEATGIRSRRFRRSRLGDGSFSVGTRDLDPRTPSERLDPADEGERA